MKEINIVPIFNQAAPGVWHDFARIESTAPARDGANIAAFEQDWLRYKQCFAFGAYDVTQMVGFISGFISRKNAQIQCLYVLPEYRGNKIGSQLLRKAESVISIGSRTVNLVALPGAMDFYSRAGYRSVSGFADNHLQKTLPLRRSGADVLPVFGDVAAFRRAAAKLGMSDDFQPNQPAFMYVNIDGNVNGVVTCSAMHVVNKGPIEYIRKSLSGAMSRYLNAVAARGATR